MSKVVVVSGGSSGIGAAVVDRFLNEDYFVYVLDIKKPMELSPRLIYIHCDMLDIEAIKQSVDVIVKGEMGIDALVCNAGAHFSASLLDSTEADFDRMITLNLKSYFFLTQKILPLMIKNKKGSIVYMGSDQTLIAKKNSALYGLTKAALGSLTKTTALDFASEGIRANLVAAGTVETPLYHAAIRNYCNKTGADINIVHQEQANEQPLGRIGQPKEIANLIYFLCSDEASYITGAIVPIDGGYTAK